jgi:hypothetical protein
MSRLARSPRWASMAFEGRPFAKLTAERRFTYRIYLNSGSSKDASALTPAFRDPTRASGLLERVLRSNTFSLQILEAVRLHPPLHPTDDQRVDRRAQLRHDQGPVKSAGRDQRLAVVLCARLPAPLLVFAVLQVQRVHFHHGSKRPGGLQRRWYFQQAA